MIRKIIKIDDDKCNGCGACAAACHEGAIGMVGGKAKLLRDDYCDGLGDCLPECPTGAISFEEREAKAYDEKAVLANKQGLSQLAQWPCQIKLVPENAPYFNGCDLLIAADCTAYAYGRIHQDYMRDRITVIGCPKLDAVDYSEKLTKIFASNDINSVTLLRMEVPCCGGLEYATKMALQNSGREIPLQVITISINGEVIDN
ncbi:MAG: 4Fe-4S binding protein [Bacillota bacterium]|nr:4Fe-4S binding protein [Bacillota bacterium]